jgi:hypothetical protein
MTAIVLSISSRSFQNKLHKHIGTRIPGKFGGFLRSDLKTHGLVEVNGRLKETAGLQTELARACSSRMFNDTPQQLSAQPSATMRLRDRHLCHFPRPIFQRKQRATSKRGFRLHEEKDLAASLQNHVPWIAEDASVFVVHRKVFQDPSGIQIVEGSLIAALKGSNDNVLSVWHAATF